jgi:hypothetical protein
MAEPGSGDVSSCGGSGRRPSELLRELVATSPATAKLYMTEALFHAEVACAEQFLDIVHATDEQVMRAYRYFADARREQALAQLAATSRKIDTILGIT